MEHRKTLKNEEIACAKSGRSSFTSAMLCFLHGFNDRDDKNPSRDQKNFRFRLLRKSRASLKLLSTSSPAMTSQSQITSPASPKPEKKEGETPTASKSRQKKFHRHFPSVESDEQVLNYYSCALISDILLQGHLYITKNYFAFYSNVFGYVTKLLIPMPTVEKITKEKTARIIPNAVGISTAEEKHVFGSLISRENTYKYMTKVWEVSQKALEEAALEAEALSPPEPLELASESDSSETKEGESEKEGGPSTETTNSRLHDIKTVLDRCQQHHQDSTNIKRRLFQKYRSMWNLPVQKLILYAAIFLLLTLTLSATLILYRISKIHEEYVSLMELHDPSLSSDHIYNQLLRFSVHLHSKSSNSMHNFIDSNLHQIAKVRQNLELLSSILMPKEPLQEANGNSEEDLRNDNS